MLFHVRLSEVSVDGTPGETDVCRAWGARVDAFLPDNCIVRGIRRDEVEPRVS